MGRGERLLESRRLPSPRRHLRDLIPTLQALCREHGAPAPGGGGAHKAEEGEGIDEVYISIGPGSFTGLRIAVTSAKLLARVWGARLVAVPTLDVVVRNAPERFPHVAVCLNAKRGQCYTRIYQRTAEAHGEQRAGWLAMDQPILMTPAEVCRTAPRPLAVVGERLPEHAWPHDVTVLGAELAVPRAEVVWELGRALAAAGEYVDPLRLTPLYVRLPEAERRWRERMPHT